MINQIISALKISLGDCKKFEDPIQYVYELNQVLNRYKTNLFIAMTDGKDYEYDPKEFFQFRIATSWRVGRGWNGESKFLDSAPILLYVSGFYPEGHRKNRESSFNKTADITDLIDLERIRLIKNDYYADIPANDRNYFNEHDLMEAALGTKYGNLSMHFNLDRTADEVIVFNFQLNAIVYDEVVRKQQLDHIARHTAKEEASVRAKKKKEKVAVVSKEEPSKAPIDVLFGSQSPEQIHNRLATIRAASKRQNSPYAGPKARRNLF
ncbi:hypothetical protein PQD71_gp194 [Kosakonia phage Kc263]|uniref:Uncharacterized protein n=1 Tax=Kosakonia phage Kc263 TaxID=2863194 RepID=A0AAE7WFI5_9CAUD|nr:hypothetical protein PQD71_gp194 [Kosakonia phage Kc263]QYN80132.1 hypothetical protein [Kosakonia phage Kc263]